MASKGWGSGQVKIYNTRICLVFWQLVTVNENLSAQKDGPEVSGSSNTMDELEVVRNQNEVRPIEAFFIV